MGVASTLLPASVVVATWASALALRQDSAAIVLEGGENHVLFEANFDPTSGGGFTLPPGFGGSTTNPVTTGTTMSAPFGPGGPGGDFNLPMQPGVETPMPTPPPSYVGQQHQGFPPCPTSCADPADLCNDYPAESTDVFAMFKRNSKASEFDGITDCSDVSPTSPICQDQTYGPAVSMLCAAACGACPSTPCSNNDEAAKIIMEHAVFTGWWYAVDGCQDTNGTLLMGGNRVQRHSDTPGIRLACPSWSECGLLVASATNDPHVTNLAGEHFDINSPADHVLLRVPADEAQTALLELRGVVRAGDSQNACAMYIKMATISGEWLGNATMQVRPLQRDAPGSNGAGSRSVTPFSLRLSVRSEEGRWQSPADFGAVGLEPVTRLLSESASLSVRSATEEFGDNPEGQSFEILVGQDARATIMVSQAGHQALNVQVSNIKAFGQTRLGGLLGTEPHSRDVEQPTEECKASRASQPGRGEVQDARQPEADTSSRLAAAW